MAHDGTGPTIDGTARRKLAGIAPGAAFLSHVLVDERGQSRMKQQTPVEAFDAYTKATGRTVRRLPAGYLRTLSA